MENNQASSQQQVPVDTVSSVVTFNQSVPPSYAPSNQAILTPASMKESEPSKKNETQQDFAHIDQIEVYVEKSRAIGLGQRLLWHIEKMHKPMSLLRNTSEYEQYTLKPITQKTQPTQPRPNQECIYTEQSNTIFYYSKNKVVLLLDFSHSTATAHVDQEKSYFTKMREALEVVLKNLIFQINSGDSAPKQNQNHTNRFDHNFPFPASSLYEESQTEFTDYENESQHFHHSKPFGPNPRVAAIIPESKEEESCANQSVKRGYESETQTYFRQNPMTQSQIEEPSRVSNEKKRHYRAKIWISIVISGMPGQNIHLIHHNQRIDQYEVQKIIKKIEKYLDEQQRQLRKNIQKGLTQDLTKGALQVHLDNGQYVLNLMHKDAKPLLIFFTDNTNSLRQLDEYKKRKNNYQESLGQINQSIHKLHLSDARVVSIDLQSSHRTNNAFGFINQESELHYITNITGGAHFTYQRLMEFDQQLDPNSSTVQKDTTYGKKFTFKMTDNQFKLIETVDPSQANRTQKESSIQYKQINTLQKFLFARPCNSKVFKQTEIAQLLQEQPQLSLQAKVNDPFHRICVDHALPQLFFENKVLSLLQTRRISQYDYEVEKVGFFSLVEFRTKLGFHFQNVEFVADTPNLIASIYFTYQIDSQIQLICQLVNQSKTKVVISKWSVNAPESILTKLSTSSEQKDQTSIRHRLQSFIQNVKSQDKNFKILDQIVETIQKVHILFQNDELAQLVTKSHPQSYNPDNYADPPHFEDSVSLFAIQQKEKPTQIFAKEEEAEQYLKDNKQTFSQLLSLITSETDLYKWKCYFRYRVITITTQSAALIASQDFGMNSANPEFWKRNINEEYQLESEIEKKIVDKITEFTTFRLNETNFLKVFENQHQQNMYRNFGLRNVDQDQETQEQPYYSFCLIKLVMQATNIAQVHFGFYQVAHLEREEYIKQFKQKMNKEQQKRFYQKQQKPNQTQSEVHKSNQFDQFKCHEKNISSMLFMLPKEKRFSLRKLIKDQSYFSMWEEEPIAYEPQEFLTGSYISQLNKEKKTADGLDKEKLQKILEQPSNEKLTFEQKIKQKRQSLLIKGISFDLQHLFWRKEWEWQSRNHVTNQQLFYRILEQRLHDGFKLVNRFDGLNNYFHFYRILRPNKEFINKPKANKVNSSLNKLYKDDHDIYSQKFEQNNNKKPEKKPEPVDILIQVIVEIEHKPGEEFESLIKESVFMEQEITFIPMEKQQQPQSKSSFKGSNSNSGDTNLVKSKEFFDKLHEHLHRTSQSLYSRINSYHQVIRQCMLSQIEKQNCVLEDEQTYSNAIKEQVCYFKNVIAQNKRQRKQREEFINSKIQTLHQEWKEYIQTRYKDLERQSQLRQNSEKKLLNQTQNVQNDEVDIQILLETAKKLTKVKSEFLQAPKIEKQGQEFQDFNQDYIEKIFTVLNQFSDSSYQQENHQDQKVLQVFVKVISREILLLIQVPTKSQMQALFEKNKQAKISFFKFSLNQIKNKIENTDMQLFLLQEKYKKQWKQNTKPTKDWNPMKRITSQPRLLNQNWSTDDFTNLQDVNQGIQLQNQNRLSYKMPGQRQRTNSEHYFDRIDDVSLRQQTNLPKNVKFGGPLSLSWPAERTSQNESSDENTKVRQIDFQDELDLTYQNYKYPRRNLRFLQFETKVKQIINNFVQYLTESFKIQFAECVLKGLRNQDNLKIQKNTIVQNDFEKAQQSMGQIKFKVDLSFLVLFRSFIEKSIFHSQLKIVDQETDKLLTETISRNFVESQFNHQILLYRANQEDQHCFPITTPTFKQTSSIASLALSKNDSFDFHQKPNELQTDLGFDLQGTPDAYSDSDNKQNLDDTLELEKPERASRNLSYKQVYSFCQNLLMKVELHITDQDGKQKDIPLRTFKEIFSVHKKETLKQKLEESDENSNKSPLSDCDEILRDEKSQECYELQFTFYMIPKYLGILRAKDVDFSAEQTEILVNDDRQEDLKLIQRIKSGIQSPKERQDSLFGAEQLTNKLYHKLNKKQIIKSIPYYFQNEERAEDSLKVYYIEEIQRKSIYGVLRRFYAVLGQHFTELIQLQRPINKSSIRLVQKYFGYLLDTQRQHLEVQLYSQKDFKSLRLAGFLKNLRELLRKGEIIKCQQLTTANNEEIFFLAFNSTNQLLNDEWNKINETTSSDYTVPFWALFKIEESETDGVKIKFVFNVPRFKLAKDMPTFRNKMYEMCQSLGKKAKIITFLQVVHETHNMMADIELSPNQIPSQSVLKSFAALSVQSDNYDPVQIIKDQINTSSTQQQSTYEMSPPLKKPTMSSKKGSKFGKLMAKSGNKDSSIQKKTFDTYDLNQSQTSFSVHQIQHTDSIIDQNKSGNFLVAEQSLEKFVGQEDKSLKLVKYREEEVELETLFGGCETLQRVFTMWQFYETNLITNKDKKYHVVTKEEENVIIIRFSAYSEEQANFKVKDLEQKERESKKNQLLQLLVIDFQGIDPPSDQLVQIWLTKLQNFINVVNIQNFSSKQSTGLLTTTEYDYLKQSNQKCVLMFPLLYQGFEYQAFCKILTEIMVKKSKFQKVKIRNKPPPQRKQTTTTTDMDSYFRHEGSFQSQKESYHFGRTSTITQQQKSQFYPQQSLTESNVFTQTQRDDTSDVYSVSQFQDIQQEDPNQNQKSAIQELQNNLFFNADQQCLLPKSTAAAKSIQKILPKLASDNKLFVSLLSFGLSAAVTTEQLNEMVFKDNQIKVIQDLSEKKVAEDLNDCQLDIQLKKNCANYRKNAKVRYSFTPQSVFDPVQKPNLPLIFESQTIDNQNWLRPQNYFQSIKTETSNATTWFQITINIRCKSDPSPFVKEGLVKQIISDFNKALAETRMELYLYNLQVNYLSRQLKLSTKQDQDYSLLRLLFNESRLLQSDLQFAEQMPINCVSNSTFAELFLHVFVFQILQHLSEKVQQYLKDKTMVAREKITIEELNQLADKLLSFQFIVNVCKVSRLNQKELQKKIIVNFSLTKQTTENEVKQIIKEKIQPIQPNTELSYSILFGKFPSTKPEESEQINYTDFVNPNQDDDMAFEPVSDLDNKLNNPEFTESIEPKENEKQQSSGLMELEFKRFCQKKSQESNFEIVTEDQRQQRGLYVLHRHFFTVLDWNHKQITILAYNNNLNSLTDLKNKIKDVLASNKDLLTKELGTETTKVIENQEKEERAKSIESIHSPIHFELKPEKQLSEIPRSPNEKEQGVSVSHSVLQELGQIQTNNVESLQLDLESMQPDHQTSNKSKCKKKKKKSRSKQSANIWKTFLEIFKIDENISQDNI